MVIPKPPLIDGYFQRYDPLRPWAGPVCRLNIQPQEQKASTRKLSCKGSQHPWVRGQGQHVSYSAFPKPQLITGSGYNQGRKIQLLLISVSALLVSLEWNGGMSMVLIYPLKISSGSLGCGTLLTPISCSLLSAFLVCILLSLTILQLLSDLYAKETYFILSFMMGRAGIQSYRKS